MPDNYAAYLTGPAKPFSVLPAPYPTCASHEVLIKVYAVAINPVDAARAAYGMYIPSYPYIVGCDAAGVILEVGSSVHHLSPGDRVLTGKSSNRLIRFATPLQRSKTPYIIHSPTTTPRSLLPHAFRSPH